MKLSTWLFTLLLLAASASAKAATVSFGALSRESGSATIHDMQNQRTWLGIDVTKGRTYAETVAATAAGGVFEGYRIAHTADAELFVAAMLLGRTNDCANSTIAICYMGDISGAPNIFGESYIVPTNLSDVDLAFYLNDGSLTKEVGYIGLVERWDRPERSYVSYDEWGTLPSANALSTVGWLLFKDAEMDPGTEVPEPASLALIGLGLLGLASSRRGRRSNK